MRPTLLIRSAAALGLAVAIAGVPGAALGAPPPPPTVTYVSPPSPNESLTPQFSGYTWYTTTTLNLYDNAACSGKVLATGTIKKMSGDYRYWYATVVVEPGSTTDVYAASVDKGGTSQCSTVWGKESGHQVYKNTAQVPIQTKLTGKPAKVVKTAGKRAKVTFKFKAVSSGNRLARAMAKTTYSCSMDGKAATSCKSGVSYKVKRGKHTFSVAASKGGVTDPTPATYKFKVKKK